MISVLLFFCLASGVSTASTGKYSLRPEAVSLPGLIFDPSRRTLTTVVALFTLRSQLSLSCPLPGLYGTLSVWPSIVTCISGFFSRTPASFFRAFLPLASMSQLADLNKSFSSSDTYTFPFLFVTVRPLFSNPRSASDTLFLRSEQSSSGYQVSFQAQPYGHFSFQAQV